MPSPADHRLPPPSQPVPNRRWKSRFGNSGWFGNSGNPGNLGWFTLAVLVLSALPGCGMQRRLTIRSSPPGAVVYIDNYQIGTTPVATDYVYYGTRQIRLEKDGFETLTVMQPIRTPWYQVFPLDFVSENLVPQETRDERTLDFQLIPQAIVPTGQLLDRAEGLRRDNGGGQLPPPAGGQP